MNTDESNTNEKNIEIIELDNKDWGSEFAELNLGNIARTRRFYSMMDSFAADPGASVLKACGSRSAAAAAYRLMNGPSLSHEVLHESVVRGTVKRLNELEDDDPILVPQDTTSVSYGMRDIQGMGYYCDSPQKGMNVHSAIALTSSGVPIGLVHQEAFTREKRKMNAEDKEALKKRPIEEKESYRWINTLKQVQEALPDEREIIIIGDRESDFYELFAAAQEEDANFLVRCVQNRCTTEAQKLFDGLRDLDPAGEITVHVARKPKSNTPAEDILVEYAYKTVEIRRPKRRTEENLPETTTLTAIHACEVGNKEDGLEWFLLTNMPIADASDAVKMIRYYQHRWKIERFHFVLKSGCRIEKKQAHSFENQQVLTLLYSVIALQIANIMYLSRVEPDLPADVFWNKDEQRLLYCTANKTKNFPEHIYTLEQAVRDIAALGGRRMSPSDGPPGLKAIWEGMDRFYTLLINWNYIPERTS